jgi:hypothetical protein
MTRGITFTTGGAMLRQWLIRAGAAVATVGMLGCASQVPTPCILLVYSGGAIVATDTATTEEGCTATVYGDSVGTDTTVSAAGVTLVRPTYTIDSVVTVSAP